ncbi:MAG TPA: hypothetical protein VI911_11740 [Patescibacteria group bacterium]|nr:hypothetical protein [Patescibacteria group bacterium]
MADKKHTITYAQSEIQNAQDDLNDIIMKSSSANPTMMDFIKKATGSSNNNKHVPRLAFMEKPNNYNNYAGIYKIKRDLLPDAVIKDIRVKNLLIAAILRTRGNALSMMGHPKKDRFDVGIKVDVRGDFKDFIEPEQMVKIQERIDNFTKLLINCGNTEGVKEDEKMTLSEFLDLSARNGLSFGRFSTEIIYDTNTKEFHRFRPADAGTIYPTVKKGETAESIRMSSLSLLESITGDIEYKKIDKKKFEEDEYAWVQVIDGMPRQAFAPEEMLVYNLFPSSDVEHNGYPVPPLDTIVSSITTFQSIELYNKLYFQNGRGARGMLVIQSDEIDQSVLEDIKQQYNASINDVGNSFRTPIFGVGKEDVVTWTQTSNQKRDGEFQFLYDQVTRNILSAFNMSPDELPGFQHLSRGTNQSSMAETSNEYKLVASRDGGLRPLILKIQDFLNEKLFPIMDPELSQLCYIALSGLDAETKQQESVRLQQDAPLHYNYDAIMEEVEKEQIGTHLGGKIPFNIMIRQIFDTYMDTSRVIGELTESPASFVDPILKYKRDQFFFQHISQLAQFNPAAVMAYYATRKNTYDTLKVLVKDYLDDESDK